MRRGETGYDTRTIAHEQLVLDSAMELSHLGHNRTRLIDCTVEVKPVLKNFQWDWVHMKGSRSASCIRGKASLLTGIHQPLIASKTV